MKDQSHLSKCAAGKEQPNKAKALDCRNFCGFYGLANFEGYCSACFRKLSTTKNSKTTTNQAAGGIPLVAPVTSAQTLSSTTPTLTVTKATAAAVMLSKGVVDMNKAKTSPSTQRLADEDDVDSPSPESESDFELDIDEAMRMFDPDDHDSLFSIDDDDEFNVDDDDDHDPTFNYDVEIDDKNDDEFLPVVTTNTTKDAPFKIEPMALVKKEPNNNLSQNQKLRPDPANVWLRPTKKTMEIKKSMAKSMLLKAKAKLANKKKRCNMNNCKQSIAVISFGCRCGGQYCTKHRLAKEHGCTFDYRQHGLEELSKANPKITADKIKKI